MEQIYKKFADISYDSEGLPTDIDIHCPDNFNFAYDVIDVMANESPDSRALVWCTNDGREKTFSFSDIARLSVQAAGFFAANGIKKGSRVMLLLKRHYSYWYVMMALHRLGAVAIPATHMLMPPDISYRVRTVGIDAVLCVGEKELCEKVKEGAPDVKLFCVDGDFDGFTRIDTELQNYPDSMERIETELSDPMLIYFTSGTTGRPKAVIHSYAYPLYHITTAAIWHKAENGGLHMTVADTGWAKASWGKLYGQWMCGSAHMVYSCSNMFTKDLLDVVKKYGVTTFCAPPTVYRSMVKNGFDASAFAGVHRCTTAGESLKDSIAQEFERLTGLHIFAGYGQTETAIITGCLKPSDGARLGRPMPLYELSIVDENDRPVKPGETGEIVLRPKNKRVTGLFIEFLDHNGVSHSPYDQNGYYHTGDVARMGDDGVLDFEGRTDDIIKSAGYRISPIEIENIMLKHADIIDCAVTGVPDGERGYMIKAFVVLRRGLEPSRKLTTSLRHYAQEHMANYKCPRAFEFCEHLPKTFSGKIRRGVLRSAK